MANKTQSWKITPAQYTALEASVKAETGISITGESGTEEAHGVKVAYDYDGKTLQITVLSAPEFIEGIAERKIKSSVDAALKSA